MDGKDGAQELLDKVLKDPSLMTALSSAKQNGDGAADADAKAE